MTNLLQKHPEILKFDEDRLKLDRSVKNYLDAIKKEYFEVYKNLKKFRDAFSNIENFDTEAIANLKKLPQWTFTPAQQQAAYNYLQQIAENYPVPEVLKSKVSPGNYLDLRNETNESKFKAELEKFADRINALPKPEKIEFDIAKIGKLPLTLLHQKDNEVFYDPIINIDTLWTLDVTQNPGLSVKDIMALGMIQKGIENREINENTILVEGTSGNTGAGIAIFAAHYGLKTILIIPDKMSQEKIDRLRYLGAHVVVTPTNVAANNFKSYYSVRDYLSKYAQGWKAGQYDNLANREAHEKVTGPEIWRQTRGEITALIATAGTCGTVSGIGRYLKNQNPNIKIIAVDTIGSILYLLKAGYTIDQVEKYAQGYIIQGFGEDIHPQNLDLEVIDHFIRVGDTTGLEMTQILPALGVVPGQSSGAAYASIIRAYSDGILENSDKVVAILPDVGVPYRNDVYSDEWMKTKGVKNEVGK